MYHVISEFLVKDEKDLYSNDSIVEALYRVSNACIFYSFAHGYQRLLNRVS